MSQSPIVDNRMDDSDRVDVENRMDVENRIDDDEAKHRADVGQALYQYVIAQTQSQDFQCSAIEPADAQVWKGLHAFWDISGQGEPSLQQFIRSFHWRDLLGVLRFATKTPEVDDAKIYEVLTESREKCTYRPVLEYLNSVGAYKCPTPPLEKPEAYEREFIETFNAHYQGTRHIDLLRTLDSYFDTFSPKADSYSCSTSFVQASCTGKSRTMDEMAKIRITLPFNVREELDPGHYTYPPPDEKIRDYLLDIPASERETGRAHWRGFFKSLFDETLRVLKCFTPTETEPLSLLLYRYLERDPGHHRRQFFESVVAAAKGAPLASEAELLTAARKLTDFITDMSESERAHEMPGSVQLVIVFDEAHSLAKDTQGPQWTRLVLMESTLASLKALPIFTVSLSTNSKLEQLAPSSYHHPSFRAAKGHLIPPLTEFFLFDAHVKSVAQRLSVGGITLQKLCSPELLVNFGRYQWGAMYRGSTHPGDAYEARHLNRIVEFGVVKIKSRGSRNSPLLGTDEFVYKLACLAIRIMLEIDTSKREGRRLASQLVKSHMRIVVSIPEDRETMETNGSSEAVLVEASARLLQLDDINMFDTLRTALSSNLIAKGERGELAARILFIRAQDRVKRHTLDYHCMRFHGPILLLEFLQQLLTDEAYDYIKTALPIEAQSDAILLEDAFKDAWVNFSHFGQARDYEVVKLDTLSQFFYRGIILQCWDNQQTLDFAAPMVFAKSIDDPLEQEDFSLFGVQVKNRVTKVPTVLHVDAFSPSANRPTLSILLELGEANAPKNIANGAIAFESQERVETRSNDENKNTLQRQHYQITVHGLEALRLENRDRDSLEYLLNTRQSFESFPRRNQNLDILKSSLPFFEKDGVTMEWWPRTGSAN